MSVHLVGGGPGAPPGPLAPFPAEARAAAAQTGARARVDVVVSGHRLRGRRSLPAHVAALAAGPEVDVRPVSLRRRRGVPAGAVAAAVRAGTPYPGFSAGAAPLAVGIDEDTCLTVPVDGTDPTRAW